MGVVKKMKLIIDISKGAYYTAIDGHLDACIEYFTEVIKNSTPLDNLRAEIMYKSNEPDYLHENEDWSVGLEMALSIIDKYTAESEE